MPNKNAKKQRVFIDKVHLKGFKSIEDISIDFKRGINILIGKNGSGKSNFLKAIYQSLTYFRKENIFFDFAVINFATNDNHSFLYSLEKPQKASIYRNDDLDLEINVKEKFIVDSETAFDSSIDGDGRKRFTFNNKSVSYGTNPMFSFRGMGYKPIFPLLIEFNLPEKIEYIDSSGSFTIDFEDLLGATYKRSLNFLTSIIANVTEKIEDELYKFGSGPIPDEKIKEITLNSIANLLIPQEIIVDSIKTYCPIEDLRFNKNINIYNDNKRLIVENIKLEFKINGNWMPWSQLSDGTKRLFYIVSEVTFNDGIILIEEPELGIHPHQFNLLMDFLKEQSEYKQILISTHSPKALDHLSPEELDSILIASYDFKKGTQIRHLANQEIIKAKKYMKEVGFFSDYWLLSDLEE
jgi:AAA15 family ATPase/GTPase